MSNTLVKDTRTTYTPGTLGIPGNPGQPYRQAYTYYDERYVCVWTAAGSGDAGSAGNDVQWIQDSNGQWHPATTGGITTLYGAGPNYTYQCGIRRVPVYVPAQPYIAPTAPTPATESQLSYDYNLGWNAGARSEAFIPGSCDGRITFEVPPGVSGAFVGFNGSDEGAGYRELEHAIYCSHGIARVYESGVDKHYIGSYAAGTVFTIRRDAGVVTYLVDGVLEYTSATESTSTVFMDTSLYSGGDTVDNPTIAAEASAYLNAEPAVVLGYEGSYAFAVIEALPATITSNPGSNGYVTAEPGAVFGADRPFAQGIIVAEPATVSGGVDSVGEVVPSYGIGAIVAVPAMAYGFGPLPTWGNAAIVAEVADVLGVGRAPGDPNPRSYGEATITAAPGIIISNNYEGQNEASMGSLAVASSAISGGAEIVVVMNSAAQITSVFALQTLIDASVTSEAQASSSWAIESIIDALMYSVAAGRTVTSREEEAREVWVINAETSAATRYENYPFNSFAELDGIYYGCRADGIYRLDGDTDAGSPIQAMIGFGKRDFGTSALKHVTNAYVGLSSTGKVFLKVTYEGTDYLYAARDGSEHMQVQRVDLGRGIRANYLEFELYNADGDDFELATVEFAIVPMSRRV